MTGCDGRFFSSRTNGAAVGIKLVAEFPVLGFGIVGAQLDDHHVGQEGLGLCPCILLPKGEVAFLQHGAAAHPEVADDPMVAQHPGQLCGVGIARPVGDAGAEGDAVADAGHPNRGRIFGGIDGLGKTDGYHQDAKQ